MELLDRVVPNTKWISRNGDAKVFVVLHVVELDGKNWVHYRDEECPSCHEFSCYLESFLSRFNRLENQGDC